MLKPINKISITISSFSPKPPPQICLFCDFPDDFCNECDAWDFCETYDN